MVCGICIFSCATRDTRFSSAIDAGSDKLFVNLTDSSGFFLLPTEGIEKDMDMIQFLSAEFMGRNIFLQALVKADKYVLEMLLFNELGVSMGELYYRDGVVDFSSNILPRTVMRLFNPVYIVADFQLCFYDPILLSKALEDSGLTLVITDGDSNHSNRRILNGNDVIIEIEKNENTVKLINHLRRYTYTMEGDFHEI